VWYHLSMLVLVLGLLLLVGPVPLAIPARVVWWNDLERADWTPDARTTLVGSLLAAVIDIAAAWLLWSADGWGLPLYLWAAHVALSPMWWALLLGRRRFSAAFTILCADLTAMALALASFVVFEPAAGWLFTVPVAWTTWLGVVSFVLWQSNQPSRH
jgi:tryptophan-rich sensory protein